MINWSEVAPALKALLSDLAPATAVTPAFAAQWHGAKREYVHPDVQKELIMRVTRVADVQTERRFNYTDDPAPTLTEEVFGMREFTLEVRVESHDHSESESRWSWSMIERVRSRLFFTRSASALLAVGVGIVRIGDSRDVSFKFDKHIVNAAMFEATFNAAFSLEDAVTTDWFERAALTSNFQDPAGVTLSSPPNLTDELVPPEE